MRKRMMIAGAVPLFVCLVCMPVMAAMDGQVDILNTNGPNGYWNVTIVGSSPTVNYDTFCIEQREYAQNSPPDYYYKLTSSVLINSQNNVNGPGAGVLQIPVAWLYNMWRNYRPWLQTQVPGATWADVQVSLWNLQGELDAESIGQNAGRVSALKALAVDPLVNTWTDTKGYQVMNLYMTLSQWQGIGSPSWAQPVDLDGTTYYRCQDLLSPGPGEPPVPEPVTMLTAFMAISGLGMYIRKRMKTTVVAA